MCVCMCVSPHSTCYIASTQNIIASCGKVSIDYYCQILLSDFYIVLTSGHLSMRLNICSKPVSRFPVTVLLPIRISRCFSLEVAVCAMEG